MQSSFLYLVTRHPDLLVCHAQGYLALAKEAWGKQMHLYRLQLLWMTLALACFVAAAVHAGMLVVWYFAPVPAAQLPSLWIVFLLPAVFLAAGSACLAKGILKTDSDPFSTWNEQIATDLALLRTQRTR